ncbi:MAG: hypothetical protein GX647_01985 [Clostridiales bacterium]|nr:hypothetical protein [Clostridiales bacterium]
MKMSVIGMGKQVGAEVCHRRGRGFMAENIARIAGGVLRRANITLRARADRERL